MASTSHYIHQEHQEWFVDYQACVEIWIELTQSMYSACNYGINLVHQNNDCDLGIPDCAIS